MGWGGDYRSPDEQAEHDAQQAAAVEAQARSKMTQFERRVVDSLTSTAESMAKIAESMAKIAANTAPMYELDSQTGEVKVHHGIVHAVRAAEAGFASIFEVDPASDSVAHVPAEGDSGVDVSAEPDGAASGSAHPTIGAMQDTGANCAAASEFFPQHGSRNQ